jgi:uncharacterized protein
VSTNNDILRLNVGFIVHETVGYSRVFELDAPSIHLHPDLDLVNLLGEVKVTRTAKGLLLQAEISASVSADCSRCLNDFLLPLTIDFTELYAFSPNSTDESGLILPENGKIDLEPLIREEMLLAIPISPICQPDCKGLCPICGENLNEGSHIIHQEEAIDPRLSILKDLIDKDTNPQA